MFVAESVIKPTHPASPHEGAGLAIALSTRLGGEKTLALDWPKTMPHCAFADEAAALASMLK